MAVTETDVEDRGHLFRAFGDGFHQCWYPVAVRSALGRGQLIGTDFCDGRIVMFRGDDGVVRAMTPYCPHMGSDLSVGDVVGNDIRCAFHHWQFGGDGRCTNIPSGDRIPAAAVFSFPVTEKHGLIWVFWGATPSYEVPDFPDVIAQRHMVWRPFEVPLHNKLTAQPWVFATNLFDFQHFRVVHGIPNLDPDIETEGSVMRWTADLPHPAVGAMSVTAECWGTNAVLSYGSHGDSAAAHVAGGSPMGTAAGTKYFMTIGAEVEGEGDDAVRTAEESLEQQQAMHTTLINEDIPVLNSLRLGDDHLVASDRKLARYLRYARDFPRTTMAELEASVKN